jgi:DNA (cytosine-5)-methyltransferase 1
VKVLGLFSGIGGFELGLQRSGMKIEAYCEIENHCLKVLRKNFPEADEFLDIRGASFGSYDVVCGGFPCQDISIAGKNAGLLGGDKSSLWKDFIRVISDVKPKYAIIENVSALLGRGLEIVIQNLAEIGYDSTYTVYDSKYFGVPQRRRRVYIVAVRDGIPEGADLLNFAERDRSCPAHRQKVTSVENGFAWDFTKGEGEWDPFAFFTRQRSDQFSASGLSSTLAKRDYKSYTDVLVVNGLVRRVSPSERLLLQGFPRDWWEGCGLTESQKYTCNGMTVPVVEHIGRLILEFDKNV